MDLCFFRKFLKFSKFSSKNETTKPDRTFLWHYHFSILLALSKASIDDLKQISKLTDTYSLVIITQINIFMVTCICVRGSTLARLAVVLVLLSIGNTPALRVTLQSYRSKLYESSLLSAAGVRFMFQTGGKPSTWFPPVGLVELYESRESFSKLRKFEKYFEGGAPALRVIRAGTRLTVHRSFPYQNHS